MDLIHLIWLILSSLSSRDTIRNKLPLKTIILVIQIRILVENSLHEDSQTW